MPPVGRDYLLYSALMDSAKSRACARDVKPTTVCSSESNIQPPSTCWIVQPLIFQRIFSSFLLGREV